MKTNLNHSQKVRAQARQRTGFAPSGAAPESYPDCGMTRMPIPEAIARAAILLRSLSAVNNALRLNRV